MATPRAPTDRAAWLAERRRNEIERFDTRFAADYDEEWGAISATHARMIERVLDCCPPACEVLDVACGTGKYWPLILASGRRPVGMDQSAGMLRQAAAKHPDVPTGLRAMTDLDAIDAYEAIACVDAMEYVPPEEWPVVLAAFHRALRPAGHLYLTVEQADPDEVEADYRWSLAAGHPVVPGESVRGSDPREDDGYHYFPATERVHGWLDAAGFAVLDQTVGDGYLHLVARRR